MRMRELLILAATGGMFAFCGFLMDKIDSFLREQRRLEARLAQTGRPGAAPRTKRG